MSNQLEILIATDNDTLFDKLTSSLGEDKLYNKTTSLDDFYSLINEKTIDLFYIDFDLFLNHTYKIVDKIKSNIKCSLNPICLLSSNNDKYFREQMYSLGIKDLLVKPFFEKEVIDSFNKIYEDSGKFKSSLTNKTINSLISLHDCEEISFVLENRAKLYCRDIKLKAQEAKDLSTLAKFISLGVQTLPLKKLTKYFEDMGLAKELQKILTSKVKENKLSAILYALYEQERIFHGKQTKELFDYGENYGIYDELLLRYTKEEFKITDFLEYKYITSIIKDKLIEKDLAKDIFENINTLFEKIVKHTILYSGGCSVVFIGENDSFLPSIKIKPLDGKVVINNNLLQNIERENRDKIKLIKENSAYRIDAIGEKPAIVKEETAEVFFDFDETPQTDIPTVRRELISAEEFLSGNEIDFDDINILLDYENEMFEVLDILEYEENPIKHVQTAYEVINKYMSRLIYYIEFEVISSALTELAETIRDEVDESLDSKKVSNAFVIIESIMKNLRTWRNKIFVEQDIDDIHFLDDSIKADCYQLISFLKPAEEDDEEIEFF